MHCYALQSFWLIFQFVVYFIQRLGANFKNFAANFVLFLAFCHKNAENDYFDKHLACAAPKPWLKYTSPVEVVFPMEHYILCIMFKYYCIT